jgi:inward rectifier potassium channel
MRAKSAKPAGSQPTRQARRAAAREAAALAQRPRFSNATAARRDILVVGNDAGGLRDFYHGLLTIHWWTFFFLLVAVYLGANFAFAVAYWLDPGGLEGAHRGSFADAFFFSVETLSTIGYGGMTPKSLFANIVVTIEAFTGLGLVAVATGLILARVSRPTARVMFSRICVITPFDGVPALMFRAANQRGNQILEAEASVHLFSEVMTKEGFPMRRFRDLALVRPRQPMFALTWTLIHVIDETSPLYGATAESLVAGGAEIVVGLSGVDEIYAQRIYARHSYLPDEVVWGRRLADVLDVDALGRRVVNYHQFHEVAPLEASGSD